MTAPDSPTSRLERRAAAWAVAVGAALMAVKFLAYWLTGSAAVFSDAVESIVNILASSLALYALSLAHAPADEGHPYGHGKVEFISAAFEGGAICVASVFIAVKTVDLLLFRELQVERLGPGLALVAITIVVNGGVGWGLVRLGRRTGSLTLEADGRHLASDAATSAAALAALGIVKLTGWVYADPIAALLIAGYIGWVGWGLFTRAMGGLMDRQDEADHRVILRILDGHKSPEGPEPRICSYHKVRHRHAGRYHWVDLHIRLPGDMSVRRSHEAATAIEEEIERALGEANATAHVEPCDGAGCVPCGSATRRPA
jgi:cation diffusion facilitator family transporter